MLQFLYMYLNLTCYFIYAFCRLRSVVFALRLTLKFSSNPVFIWLSAQVSRLGPLFKFLEQHDHCSLASLRVACSAVMKKCVVCRQSVEKSIPFTMCCGGRRKYIHSLSPHSFCSFKLPTLTLLFSILQPGRLSVRRVDLITSPVPLATMMLSPYNSSCKK